MPLNRRSSLRGIIGLLASLWAVITLSGCALPGAAGENQTQSGPLIIFHAGSLAVPVEKLSARFQELHPGVKVLTEAAGSLTTARKVSELGREADLVMSADYQVINSLLIPDHASWNVIFARNTMVVVYTDQSAFAREVAPENWYEILTRDGVVVGRSNPQADPNGYRTLLVWQLAEAYYGLPGLAAALEANSPPQYIRPKETDLIPLLQTGEIDYAYNYISVAIQHDLRWISLPDQINLSNPDFREFYQTAEVALDGSEPGEVILRKGEPILYGLTIPHSAPHPQLAADFLAFLFSPEGSAILQDQGQIPLVPPLTAELDLLPPGLAGLAASWE